MTYKLDAGQQWLRDVSTNELVGIKDSVDGEERVIAFSETNSVSGLVIKTLWVGTQAQYDAIVTKDANTQYNTDVGIYIGYTLVSGGAGTTVPVVSASRELTKNDCVQRVRGTAIG